MSPFLRETRCLALFLLAMAMAMPQAARAANDDEQLQMYLDQGKAAFGLGKFSDAAEAYESAFALKPTPALLYNAAQAHRMAGHKERALDLYQSYLRLYGQSGPNREQAAQHVETLSQTLAEEKRVTTAPPNEMATDPDPADLDPVPVSPKNANAPPRDQSDAALTVAHAGESHDDRSITSKPWFWVGVGGAVVAATVVVLALTLGGSSDPNPTAGTIRGN